MPYRKTIRELEKELHTNSVNGLSEKEAQKRLLENGENELLQKHTDSIWKLFVNQFKDPMVIILIFGAFLSAFKRVYRCKYYSCGNTYECAYWIISRI